MKIYLMFSNEQWLPFSLSDVSFDIYLWVKATGDQMKHTVALNKIRVHNSTKV